MNPVEMPCALAGCRDPPGSVPDLSEAGAVAIQSGAVAGDEAVEVENGPAEEVVGRGKISMTPERRRRAVGAPRTGDGHGAIWCNRIWCRCPDLRTGPTPNRPGKYGAGFLRAREASESEGTAREAGGTGRSTTCECAFSKVLQNGSLLDQMDSTVRRSR